MDVLERGFYQRGTVGVARGLLGQVLVRRTRKGLICGRIVETEAYDGPEDLACHSCHGKTPRTKVMFGPAGQAYVYLIYGVHHCLNVVTGKPGAAVLIRALEPLDGAEKKAASGPGKLCHWMNIDRSFNGWDLTLGRRLWLADDGESSDLKIESSPRIGVDYAGRWAKKPWQFFVKGNKNVS